MADAKRRLPSWMLGMATPIPTPENQMVDNVAGKEGTGNLTSKSKLIGEEENHKVDNIPEKKATRKSIKKPQLVGNEENHKVDNCAEKKGTKKLIKKHQFVRDEDDSCLPDKKKRRRTKKQVEAEMNSTNNFPKKDNAEVEEDNEDEEELTVDDLVSIAKEYVDDDARKQREVRATVQPETGKQIKPTSVASIKDLEKSTLLPLHTSPGRFSNSYETRATVQEHSAEEEITHTFTRTGDPAQDMLDLFLGPLLKKSNIEVTNHESYKDDILLDHYLQKQSQKEESENQLPTLMKKKSSLRDKVAMLLK